MSNEQGKKFYITFGQSHAHAWGGKTFDKDCVAVIEADNTEIARKKAFEVFGPKWSMFYEEEPDMSYFPRGFLTGRAYSTPHPKKEKQMNWFYEKLVKIGILSPCCFYLTKYGSWYGMRCTECRKCGRACFFDQ